MSFQSKERLRGNGQGRRPVRTEAGSGVSRLGAPLGATAGSAAITDQGDVRREEGTGRGDGLLPAAPLHTPPPPEGDERQCRL